MYKYLHKTVDIKQLAIRARYDDTKLLPIDSQIHTYVKSFAPAMIKDWYMLPPNIKNIISNFSRRSCKEMLRLLYVNILFRGNQLETEYVRTEKTQMTINYFGLYGWNYSLLSHVFTSGFHLRVDLICRYVKPTFSPRIRCLHNAHHSLSKTYQFNFI